MAMLTYLYYARWMVDREEKSDVTVLAHSHSMAYLNVIFAILIENKTKVTKVNVWHDSVSK